ncbi:glycosyltransferase family 4 protein [Bacillus timonensis]|nr:glycosyltransferase family 4 protein [Bacillus timonensis]
MKNILLLTDKLKTGGAEIYFCKLENHLSHPTCNFFTAAGPGELENKIEKVQRFTKLSRNHHLYNLAKLFKVIRKHHITIIHANSLRMVWYGIFIKQFFFKKLSIVYTKHNVTLLERNFQGMFSKILNRYTSKIITVSNFEKENLISLGVQPEKIITIYNGVDLNQFTFSPKKRENTFRVGILARLSQEKNHRLFLQIANFLKEHDDIVFHIAGEGPELLTIKSMITKLGLTKRVILEGHIQHPETFIKRMDVLLLTSFREVFPMVIIEAMATGTPILSVDVGGVKEAISDHQTGYLLPYKASSFAEKLLYLKANPHKHEELRQKARQKVETHYTKENMVKQTIDVYLNCESKQTGEPVKINVQ